MFFLRDVSDSIIFVQFYSIGRFCGQKDTEPNIRLRMEIIAFFSVPAAGSDPDPLW